MIGQHLVHAAARTYRSALVAMALSRVASNLPMGMSGGTVPSCGIAQPPSLQYALRLHCSAWCGGSWVHVDEGLVVGPVCLGVASFCEGLGFPFFFLANFTSAATAQ